MHHKILVPALFVNKKKKKNLGLFKFSSGHDKLSILLAWNLLACVNCSKSFNPFPHAIETFSPPTFLEKNWQGSIVQAGGVVDCDLKIVIRIQIQRLMSRSGSKSNLGQRFTRLSGLWIAYIMWIRRPPKSRSTIRIRNTVHS